MIILALSTHAHYSYPEKKIGIELRGGSKLDYASTLAGSILRQVEGIGIVFRHECLNNNSIRNCEFLLKRKISKLQQLALEAMLIAVEINIRIIFYKSNDLSEYEG